MEECFVIMPFGDPFDEYYKKIIEPTIKKCGLVSIRADEINNPGTIINQIWKGIYNSKLCVCDITNRNPNVMYELGLAHAINKPVVTLVQNVTEAAGY